jgi:hypothetical protein
MWLARWIAIIGKDSCVVTLTMVSGFLLCLLDTVCRKLLINTVLRHLKDNLSLKASLLCSAVIVEVHLMGNILFGWLCSKIKIQFNHWLYSVYCLDQWIEYYWLEI